MNKETREQCEARLREIAARYKNTTARLKAQWVRGEMELRGWI